jgi:large-conductance mechanosensitive channel
MMALSLTLKEAPPPPTKDQELLMEIRDLLKAGLPAGERRP